MKQQPSLSTLASDSTASEFTQGADNSEANSELLDGEKNVTTDEELIAQAETLVKNECKYLGASRLLDKVCDRSLLQEKHHRILKAVEETEETLRGELSPTISLEEWKKQSESHAKYDFNIYYKVGKDYKLTVRIDTVLESSLVTPVLSIFNESQLFSSWMPSWKFPRTGFRRSDLLKEMGRGDQIILVTVDMPFPIAARETVQRANAVDAIDEYDAVLIQIHDVASGDDYEGYVIPEPEKGNVRVDFDGGMVLRACPDDHPALENSKKTYPADEPKILLSITQQVDPHVRFVPLSVVNFFTRHVIKGMLISLLEVAEQVRSGERPEHKKAIGDKPELYGWIEERVNLMCSKIARGKPSPLES